MSQEQVVLPSIREMFPEHLLKEDRASGASSTRRRDSRYSSQSPQLPYLSRPQEPSRRTGALPPSAARSPFLSPSASSPHLQPTSSSSTLSHPHTSSLAQHSSLQSHPRHAPPPHSQQQQQQQQQQGQFSVLRSDPSSTSLKHVVSSNTLPGRGAIPSASASSATAASSSQHAGNTGAGSPIFRVSLPPSSSRDRRSAIPHPHQAPHPHRSHPDLRNAGLGISGGDIPMAYSLPPPSSHPPPRRHSASSAPSQSHPSSSQQQTTYPAIISFPVTSSSSRPAQQQHDSFAEEASDEEGASDGNGKKHVCPTCFKRFNRPSSLRIHVNTHTGATPFRCPWPNCGREFNVNSNMRRHYRNHTSPGLTRSGTGTQAVTDTRRRRRRNPPSSSSSPSFSSTSTSASFTSTSTSSSAVPPPSHTAQQHMISQHQPQHTSFVPSPPISSFSISEESDDEVEGEDDDMSPAPPYKEEDELYGHGRRSSESLLTRGVSQINVSPVRVKRERERERASTPGSSFHSSSPSPSPSPVPERQWRGGREREREREERRYSASKPYARAVSSTVSTALRPVAYAERGARGDEMDVW